MNSHTINKIAQAASKLFLDHTLIVNFKELADATNERFDLHIHEDEIFTDRFRLIRTLRTGYFLLVHTVTDSILFLKDMKDITYVYDYIPCGSRRVYGLRFVKSKRDPILIASRRTGAEYTCARTITVLGTSIEIGHMNSWTNVDFKRQAEAIYLRQALIEGNGHVTLAMRKMLGLREDIT